MSKEYTTQQQESFSKSVANIPKIEKFSIQDVNGDKVYDIDTNLAVEDGIQAAHTLINDLAFDSRVAKMLVSMSNQDEILLNGILVDKEQLMEIVSVASKMSKADVEIVELTSNPIPDRQKISDAWVDGLEYRGYNVYKTVYEDPNNQKLLEETVSELHSDLLNVSENDFEVQECYLGYSPSKDVFVMGFDGWYTERSEDYDGEETEESGNCSPYIVFSMNNGIASIEKGEIADASNTWYSVGWSKVQSIYPDLIGIRLD